MVYQISEGIGIRVEVFYRPEQSNPMYADFLFAYRISIENLSDFPIQLLSRHWEIIDTNGTHKTVDGEGVVGEQPIIMPGEVYRYISAAHLFTDMGKMFGSYTMLNRFNNKTFQIEIPEFQLVTPFRLN